MKAIGYRSPGDIDQDESLIDIELPTPKASGRDVLIKVSAISVNPVDTKVRRAMAPLDGDEYRILGWDAVGEVMEIGDLVENFCVGDQVWYAGDLTRAGSNAEYQLVDERIVGKKPQTLTDTEAAALPLTAISAWELLFDRLNISAVQPSAPKDTSDQSILIIGAAGGVGSILTQLAVKLTNATVIGTASRTESVEWVKSLGADFVINHHKSFSEQLNALNIPSVTYVISLNQTDQHFDQIVDVLAPQGKLALIDDPADSIDIKKLKLKSISLHWEFMYTRSMFNTHDMIKQHKLLTELAQLIDAGHIKTTVGEHGGIINADNLKNAHRKLETNSTVGKIVLEGF